MMEKRKFDEIMKGLEAAVIDERKIVTYKSLSRLFDVNPNTAKQILYNFVSTCGEKYDGLSCTYQISGKKNNGAIHTCIVNDKDLSEAKNALTEIFSETVYSVQPNPLTDLQVLYAVDTFQDTSNAKNHVITCSEAIPKPENELIKPIQVLKPKQEGVKRMEVVKEKENVKKVVVEAQKEDVKPEAKKTKSSSISSMFAAQNQKPKTKKPEQVEKAKEEVVKEEKKSDKAKTSKRKAKESKNDDTKDKRKRIKVFSSSEDEDVEIEERERSPSPMLVEQTEEKIEEEPNNEIVHKRKKQKIVDKTVMTDEGYIETIKQVVVQTDSEEEENVQEKTEVKKSPEKSVKKSPKKPIQKKSPVSPKKGKSKPSTDGRKQSSLLAFFKKS